MDLPVTVPILFGHTMKEFQFSWETFLVTDGSNLVSQGGWYRMLIGWVVMQPNIQI
jgi:hypothetical protein